MQYRGWGPERREPRGLRGARSSLPVPDRFSLSLERGTIGPHNALMTNIFQRYAADPTLPRAEAVSAAMLSLMEQAEGDMAYLAHPFAWAPFALVGEGG